MLKNLFFLILALFTGCALPGQVLVDEAHELYEGVKTIDVKGGFCSVEIIGENRGDIQFDGEISAARENSAFRIHHEIKGDELSVWIETPSMSWNANKGKLRFIVPESTNIFVNNASGSVKVENIIYGGLIVKAASGSVSMKNTASNAKVGASSGSVLIENHQGDLEAASSSGSLKLRSVKGNILAQASSGSVRIEDSEGDVSVNVSSGSIHISGAAGAIKLKSASGSIHGSEVLLTDASSFSSASGSIHMTLLNNDNDLGYNLSSGSGSISINGERKSKPYRKDGKIMIQANTASGSQSFN